MTNHIDLETALRIARTLMDATGIGAADAAQNPAIPAVTELDFYPLGLRDVAKKVGLSAPKTTAIIRALSLQSDLDCFKEFLVGRTHLGRYSAKAVERIKSELPKLDMTKVWRDFGLGRKPVARPTRLSPIAGLRRSILESRS